MTIDVYNYIHEMFFFPTRSQITTKNWGERERDYFVRLFRSRCRLFITFFCLCVPFSLKTNYSLLTFFLSVLSLTGNYGSEHNIETLKKGLCHAFELG